MPVEFEGGKKRFVGLALGCDFRIFECGPAIRQTVEKLGEDFIRGDQVASVLSLAMRLRGDGIDREDR